MSKMITTVTTTQYRTSDNKLFPSQSEAEAHQKTLIATQFKDEFKDLVNRLLILMDNTGLWSEEKTRGSKSSEGIRGSQLLKELKAVVEAEFDEDKYYNSACW